MPFVNVLYLLKYGPIKHVDKNENPIYKGKSIIMKKNITLKVLPIIRRIQWTILNILRALRRLYMLRIKISVYN
jgi:hypothetical protein